jgi:DNA-binding LacI/PurR family transcriptional regulator
LPMKDEEAPEKHTAPSGRPTSYDIAKLAGVSRTQVSYVMNGTDIEHVSEEKRRRILDVARSLGYSPHHSAQALRRGYSNEFSIFFPAPATPLINEMIGKIHESGLAADCMPVQYSFNSYRDLGRRQKVLDKLLSRRPVGVFCSLIDLGMEEIGLIRSKGIDKILVLDIEPHDDFTTLFLPVESIGYIAAKHLMNLGHRDIGILKPSDSVQRHGFERRMQGMKRAFAADPNLRLRSIDWPEQNIRPTFEYAEQFVDCMLSLIPRPTGLNAYSDDFALPILAALRLRGIRVPDDISIVGADDSKYSSLSQPSLTSISFDASDIGMRAVALINSLITGIPPEERFLKPPVPVIVERESTGNFEENGRKMGII